MTCQSVEAEEVDLSGLVESIVDSDEEDLAESSDVSILLIKLLLFIIKIRIKFVR